MAGAGGFKSYPVSNGLKYLTAIYGGGLTPPIIVVEPVTAYEGTHFIREDYSFTNSCFSLSVNPDIAPYFLDQSDVLRELNPKVRTAKQIDLMQRKRQEPENGDHQQKLKKYLKEAQVATPTSFPIELLC